MMKKIILALLCACTSPLAWSDTVGFHAGAGRWYINLKGDVGQNGSTTTLDNLGFMNEISNVYWAALEHPIPIIPNIKIMHSSISAMEPSTTTQRFTIGGIQFDAEIKVRTELDLSHTDATFYYEALDNWVTFDIGVTARQMKGFVEIESEVTEKARAGLHGVLPMGYVNLQLDFPGSGLSVGATVNAISYRGDKVADVSTRISYLFEVAPLMDIGVSIGHRNLRLLAEEFDDLYADATISGSFAELVVRF